MKATHVVPFVFASVLAGGSAVADPGALNPDAFNLSGAIDREVAPTRTALEIAVGGGYTQGVGGAGSAGALEDITGAGGTIEVQLGLRMTPVFSLAAYGTLARFQAGEAITTGGHAHAATAGLQATWHGRASRSIDPWLSLGAGWRGLWLAPNAAAASSAHGAELLRVQLGVDYRISPRLAITPVVGASASVFVVEDGPMAGLSSIHNKALNLYGFTGILGRFDIGG